MRSTKRRVFSAEDQEDTSQLLKHLLGQSSYEVRLAATIFASSTPIIFYSAAAHKAGRLPGTSAGAQAHIAKPGNVFEPVNTFTQLIHHQESAPGMDERVKQEECSPHPQALFA